MTVSKDDDVINFVLNILDKLKNNNIYKEFGYSKLDDMYNKNRTIYKSNNIDDYRIDFGRYS